MNKQASQLARLGTGLMMAFSFSACATPPSTPNQPSGGTGGGLQPELIEASFLQPAAYKPPGTDVLRFYNLHTDESITITRHRGQPISKQANWFMRDYRRGEPANMDPALFDLLGKLKAAIHRKHPGLDVEFQVVSAFRDRDTNDDLRDAGGTQAKDSRHTHGMAMDIKVPGLSTVELRNIATCLKLGGVGYYAADDFVHVDTGRVRYWPSHDYLAKLKCN